MNKPYKALGLIASFLHFWRNDSVFRLCVSLIALLVALILTLNLFNAVYIYEDWRCLTADCKILKSTDKELLRIGDSL